MLQPWALIVQLFTGPVAGPGVGVSGGDQQLTQGAGEEPPEASSGGMGRHVEPFWPARRPAPVGGRGTVSD